MLIRTFLITVLLYNWVSADNNHCSDSATGICFARAREIILSQNFGIKSADTEIEAAKEGAFQADLMPNPIAGVALEKFGANEIEFTIEQTIELGGKRSLRKENAEKEIDAAINAGRISRLELETEIIRRFIPIVTARKKLNLLDSIIGLAEATNEQIERRIEVGASRKTDLIRSEIDLEKLKLERNELLREEKTARIKFAVLGGNSKASLLNVTGKIADDTEIPLLDTIRNHLQENLSLKGVDIEEQQLQVQLKQLGAEVIPDLNISAGYLRDNEESSNSPLIGLSMSIPIFNQNKYARKQVQFKSSALQQKRKNMFQLMDAEVQDIYSRLVLIDNQINTLLSSTIPKSEKVYMMMQEYYSAGNVDYLDLSQTQTELLRLTIELYDIQAERAQKLVDLMHLSNMSIEIVK